MPPVHLSRLLKPAGTALALLMTMQAAQAQSAVTGELRVFRESQTGNPQSASALANQFVPGLATRASGYTGLEAGLGLKTESLKVDSTLLVYGAGDRQVSSWARLNEGYLTHREGGYQFTAGRRIVDWDVSFGFKPNSVVQQDQFRPLMSVKRQGRNVLQLEQFGNEISSSLVWVNPQNYGLTADRQRGASESALAGQVYYRGGTVDLYGFGRYGHHTGPSVGAAAASVLTDSVSVHGSVRALKRHDGYVGPGTDTNFFSDNPWTQATLGRAAQFVLGSTWTGQSKQSLLVEYWYDGTTLSDRQWGDWLTRTGALRSLARAGLAGTGLSVPADGFGGNLAWQDIPLTNLNQRRQNLLVRAAWQPDNIVLSLDALFNPADHGQVYTLSGQWQGDGLRLNAALRWYTGPESSVLANLPLKREGLISAAWVY